MKSGTWNKAQAAVRKAQEDRAAMIMKMVSAGKPIAEIARGIGVSRQRVSQIVQRERSRAE